MKDYYRSVAITGGILVLFLFFVPADARLRIAGGYCVITVGIFEFVNYGVEKKKRSLFSYSIDIAMLGAVACAIIVFLSRMPDELYGYLLMAPEWFILFWVINCLIWLKRQVEQ